MDTHDLGERFPSGVTLCCAALSPIITGPLVDAVFGVAEAEPLSMRFGVLDGARVGYDDLGLTSGSGGGGGKGIDEADATAVDMARSVAP